MGKVGKSVLVIFAVLFLFVMTYLSARAVMSRVRHEKDVETTSPDTLLITWDEDRIPGVEVVFYHDGYLVFEKPGIRDTVNLWDLFAIKTRLDTLEARLERAHVVTTVDSTQHGKKHWIERFVYKISFEPEDSTQ